MLKNQEVRNLLCKGKGKKLNKGKKNYDIAVEDVLGTRRGFWNTKIFIRKGGLKTFYKDIKFIFFIYFIMV